MILSSVALLMILLLRYGPDVPAMRSLRKVLVEVPSQRLASVERHQLLFAIILVALTLGGGELMILFGPEFLFAYSLNLALYFDAVAAASCLAAVSAVRQSARYIRMKVQAGRIIIMRLGRRTCRVAKVRDVGQHNQAANDDEPARHRARLAA